MNYFFTVLGALILSLCVTAQDTVEFLHLTDVHVDPFYISSSPASQLCREDDVKTSDRSYFGRLGCDSPKMLVELMMEKIAKEYSDTPFMLLSGDMVTHSIDNYYNPTQVIYDAVTEVSSQIQKYFPNTVVLQSFGNNDAISHNQVPTLSEKQAFYSVYYQAFIDNSQAIKTFLTAEQLQSLTETYMDGGYYQFPISDLLHVVVLNTNYWHRSNLLSNDEETSKRQIEWFQQIVEALPDSRQLIISGHIFPGMYYQDQQFWNETYVERFRDAVYSKHANIIGYIGGHTHYGDLRSVQNYDYGWLSNLFNDKGTLEPYLSISVGPAISPIFLNNPGFRSLQLERDQVNKLYYKSYRDCFLNLTRVIDDKQYRFRKAHNSFEYCYDSSEFVVDLRPSTIAQFNQDLYQDEDLMKRYAASKAGFDPDEVLADWIIENAYEDKEILAVPRNEWNTEFLCYSKYLLTSEVSDCVKATS